MNPSEEPDDSKDEYSVKLDTLPPEVFLHVCSFLSAKFVINVLSDVCSKFRSIIEESSTWRTRIFNRWPKQYPLIPDSNLDWKEACIEREEYHELWTNWEEKMNMFHVKDAHFGSVNVVSIFKEGSICASGGRDGALKLWNITRLKEETNPENYLSCMINSNRRAHSNAWIWAIAYDNENEMMYSGGFDCKIRKWDINNPCNNVSSFSLSSPILCLAFSDNSLVSGCYGRSISLFDPRVSEQPVLQHIQHKKPVICVACDGKFIISGSEDKSVVVYDKVARKVLKTVQLEGFPLSMSYDCNQVLVGDVLGNFHVIDPTNETFELSQSYETGHKVKVTGIQQCLGSIITCSTDKTIRILEPNVDPKPIAVLKRPSEISKISAYKTTLVSANTDDTITIWIPKEECS